jgi:spore germination protein YaaH
VFDPATMHIAMLVVAAVAFAAAAEAAPFRSNSYITYEKKGLPTIDAYGRNLGSISVFSFELSEQGDVVPHEPWVPDTAEMLAAQSDGRPVVTTIVNHIQAPPGRPTQVHNGVLVHQLLSDPVRRAEHIRQVVAVANLAHGVEIDYERMLAETRPHFTTFIRSAPRSDPKSGSSSSSSRRPTTRSAIAAGPSTGARSRPTSITCG